MPPRQTRRALRKLRPVRVIKGNKLRFIIQSNSNQGNQQRRQKNRICIDFVLVDLGPPGIFIGAEVCFSPLAKDQLVVNDICMGQCQRSRSRTTDNLAGFVILRPVTRAHEFALAYVPGYDAAKVSADRIEAIAANGFVVDNYVGGVTLESLGKVAIACRVRGQVLADHNVVTEGVFCRDAAAATTGRGRDKVSDDRVQATNGRSGYSAKC